MASINVYPPALSASGITGLTSGQVVYGSSTGAVGQTANLAWDNTNGRLTIGGGASFADVGVRRTSAGGSPQMSVFNPDNTNASSSAILSSIVGGASAGDPRMQLSINGVTLCTFGLDNSDSDKFKLTFDSGGDVGTNTALAITPTTADTLISGTAPGVSMKNTSNGTADYLFKCYGLNASGSIKGGVECQLNGSQSDAYLRFYAATTTNGLAECMQVMDSTTDDDVCLLVRRRKAGAYSIQRVTEGAADSGGVGFRVLRIPN